MSLGIYRDTAGDTYLVEHTDDLCVYGQREFDRDGTLRPWSMRLNNFRASFTMDATATATVFAAERTP